MPTICYLNDDLAMDFLLGHSAQSKGSTSYAIVDVRGAAGGIFQWRCSAT